jgi:hypothetical protein
LNAQRHQAEYLRLAALRYQSQALKSPARLCRQQARRGSISNEENPAREAKADVDYDATTAFGLIIIEKLHPRVQSQRAENRVLMSMHF